MKSMSRKDDRLFKAKDVWRIYCNHLSVVEQLKFKHEFEKENGNCDEERDPCVDVSEDMVAGADTISTYAKSIGTFTGIADEVEGAIANSINGISEFLDTLHDDINEFNDIRSEDSESRWDEVFKESVPDPIARAELVAKTTVILQSMVGGAFAKSGRFAEQLLKQQGLWKPRGELVVMAKEATDESAKLAVTVIAFIGMMYKVFVEDCVDERR